MKIVDAWNYIQLALKRFPAAFELDLWIDMKTGKFFTDYTFDSRKHKKYEWVNLGVWSRRATFDAFNKYVEGVRERWSLYDVDELTPKAKKHIVNGAGPHGLGWAVPDFKFTNAANHHDLMYSCGGDMEDRKWADYCFLWRMKRDGADWLAYVYFWAVRFSGKRAFEQRFVKMSVKQLNQAFAVFKE